MFMEVWSFYDCIKTFANHNKVKLTETSDLITIDCSLDVNINNDDKNPNQK